MVQQNKKFTKNNFGSMNYTKIATLSFILILFFPLYNNVNISSALGKFPNNSLLLYQNNTLGLSFQYPISWTNIPLSSGVVFVSPYLPSIHGTAALFQVMILNLSPSVSMLDYTNSFINAAMARLPGFHLIVPPHFTTADNPNGYRLLYAFYSPNLGQINVMEKFIRNGDKVYDIMYLSPIGYFKTYTDQALTMWGTVKITEPVKISGLNPFLSPTSPSPTQGFQSFQPQTPDPLIGLDTLGSEEIIGNMNSNGD